jgi:peptide/nickel transport system substrate-binding protein
MGPDGFRYKDGVKLAPKVLFTQVSYFGRISEAIQGYMRKIGVDWNVIGYDSTIAFAKMSEQDYELWTVTFPYVSAGDLLNYYFHSANIPAPNRMNWKDAKTDEWLKAGRVALTDADRAKFYGLAQKHVTEQHLWMPVMNVAMYATSNKKLKGVRPHMLYQNTFYKGLDYSF